MLTDVATPAATLGAKPRDQVDVGFTNIKHDTTGAELEDMRGGELPL